MRAKNRTETLFTNEDIIGWGDERKGISPLIVPYSQENSEDKKLGQAYCSRVDMS